MTVRNKNFTKLLLKYVVHTALCQVAYRNSGITMTGCEFKWLVVRHSYVDCTLQRLVLKTSEHISKARQACSCTSGKQQARANVRTIDHVPSTTRLSHVHYDTHYSHVQRWSALKSASLRKTILSLLKKLYTQLVVGSIILKISLTKYPSQKGKQNKGQFLLTQHAVFYALLWKTLCQDLQAHSEPP